MWLYKNPQAFSSQSWQISVSNVFFVLNPFLLFAKMDLLWFSSQKAKKDGRRFYPTELLSRGNPLPAMSQKGFPPQGNFLHYNFLKAQCLLNIIPFSDIWRVGRL